MSAAQSARSLYDPQISDPQFQTSRSDRIKLKHYMLNSEQMRNKSANKPLRPVVNKDDRIIVKKVKLINTSPFFNLDQAGSTSNNNVRSRNYREDKPLSKLRKTNYGSFDKLRELLDDCDTFKNKEDENQFIRNFNYLSSLRRMDLRRDKGLTKLKLEHEVYPIA